MLYVKYYYFYDISYIYLYWGAFMSIWGRSEIAQALSSHKRHFFKV